MEQRALHVEVHLEDGSYWAEVPQLSGCCASDVTVTELIESVQEAVALDLAAGKGEAPAIAIELSGFDLRLKPEQPLRTA